MVLADSLYINYIICDLFLTIKHHISILLGYQWSIIHKEHSNESENAYYHDHFQIISSISYSFEILIVQNIYLYGQLIVENAFCDRSD